MSAAEYLPSSPESIRQLRDELDAKGQRLVFTNGCFDLLHTGHVRYLAEARALGDALVIALNSDSSVRALKGPNRPLNSENDRAEVLAALRSVDAVVVFDDPRATGLIKAIRPHVYAKGGDYTIESLNPEERAALAEAGTEIRILPLVAGKSTTATITKMQLPAADSSEKPPLRLAVLGSGHGSNFEAILKAISEGSLNAKVTAAISDIAECRFLQLAKTADLPAFHVDCGPEPLRTTAAAQKEIFEHLQRAGVDVVVLTGFMRILKDPTVDAWRGHIVNVHPSLLPKYKGRHAVKAALEAGEFETGCTVHLVTSEVDTGTILAQAKVPIKIGDTVDQLRQRIQAAEHQLLPTVLQQWWEQGNAPTPDSIQPFAI